MSFATSNRFALSSIARLSALYALLLIFAFGLMAAAVWVITHRMTTYELRGPLLQEAAFVREVIVTEGLAHAIEEIDLRTAHSTLLIHRLDDAAGRMLAGDSRLPHLQPGWSLVEFGEAADGRSAHVFVLTSDVSEGVQLSVGMGMSWPNSVRDVTLRTMAGMGIGVLTLALLIGMLWTNFTFRRMRALWQALRDAGLGNFQARAPVRAARAPDDIDALATRFNEMMDHTDRLVASIRRVSTNVAHDLRTPLTHLRQRLDKASAIENSPEAQQEIAAAQSKIDDILRMFDTMLHLAELETGRLRSTFSAMDLAPVVERVTDAYRPQIEESGRAIVTDMDGGGTIVGDPDLIARALSNLLENAERHATGGDRIRVALRTDSDHVLLSVEDEGPGIPDADMARVLNPFERLDESRTTSGFGLGLSIVSAIAGLHGAKLILENSRPGLRVTMSFPSPSYWPRQISH